MFGTTDLFSVCAGEHLCMHVGGRRVCPWGACMRIYVCQVHFWVWGVCASVHVCAGGVFVCRGGDLSLGPGSGVSNAF